MSDRSSCAGVWGGLLAALLLGGGTVSAAIPEAARRDARYALGYLVATHYAGVRSDGTGDSTAGLQQAIDDAYANDLVAFLTLGTYVISDTLRLFQWRPLNSDGSQASNPYRQKAFQVGGEHGPGGTRPLLRLAPTSATAAQFADPARPRPLVLLRHFESAAYPNAARTVPSDVMAAPTGWNIDTASLFNCRLRNLEFDCGGQPGAIGVVWPGAQGGCVERVRVDARGAHAGFYGLPGRNWGGIDLEVIGGEYGIRHGYGAAQAGGREVCAGVTLVGVRLIGQTRRAIDYVDFVPLVMIGFTIEKDFAAPGMTPLAPISVVESIYTANNTLVLLDGSITLRNAPPGQSAIANPGNGNNAGKTLYLRNVHLTGTTRLVESTAGAGLTATDAARWHRIDEYSYCDPRGRTEDFPAGTMHRSFATRSFVDGAARTTTEPVARLTMDTGVPPVDLVTRHLPAEGFAYFEGTSSPPAAVVTDAPFGAVAGSDVDVATADRNTLAIQAAIDFAATDPRTAGRVFLPRGVFRITGPVTLRAPTKFFGAGKTNVCVLAAHASWQPSASPGVLVRTVDDPAATCYLGSLDLQVPDRNLYEHPFTYFHWRAGVRSMTFDLRADCRLWINRPRFDAARTAPYICTRFDGAAGGRHYFFGHYEQQFTSSTILVNGGGYRSVVIDRTSQPLWFYGFNNEGGKTDRRTTDVEINGATGVVMLGHKREGGAPMLTLRDCRDVALLGGGAMRENPTERTGSATAAYVELAGVCSRILVANILVQQVIEGAGGFTLRDSAPGGVAVPFPLGVGLFKRGEFDWGAVALSRTEGGTIVAPVPAGRLANVAARVQLRAGDGPAVVGVVLSGQGTRTVLVRAVGPGLATLGVNGGVPDPAVRLYRGQTVLLENEDWDAPGATASVGAFAAAGAFALPAASRDAALVATLAPGDYSVHASARPGTGGTLILEVYDLRGDDTAQVTNLSLLGRLRPDAENPIVGFVISGAAGRRVLLRAVGPSLTAFGVGDAVRDPMLQVFAGNQAVEGNDNWGEGGDVGGLVRAMAAAGAFPLGTGSLDAVVSSSLVPGAYTVHLNGGSGTVLAEIYAP
jgi:hypothetical protein